MTVRILLWNLFDSKTTLDELRQHLPKLPDGDVWISNGSQDRFGLISFSSELPDIDRVVELIGADPVVGEEYDVE